MKATFFGGPLDGETREIHPCSSVVLPVKEHVLAPLERVRYIIQTHVDDAWLFVPEPSAEPPLELGY